MRTIRLSDIIIPPNRQRQEFEPQALQELKCSIEDSGLMHPPVLRQHGGSWILVAGERRLKAMDEIFQLGGEFVCDGTHFIADSGLVPFTNIGELSELEAEEAELDENLKRKDLTWQEHAAAVGRLHELRRKQKLEGMTDEQQMEALANPKPIQPVADTAEELTGRRDGSFQDTIRQEILVSRHLDNPVIAKAANVKEAFKLLKRDEEKQKNIALAATVGASFNANKHLLLNVNCLEWMARPENAGTIDVILTDPPYGMGADQFGDGGGKLDGIEHHYEDSYASWEKLMKDYTNLTHEGKLEYDRGFCYLSFLVAKPQAHAYIFCDIDRFHELKSLMQAAGWYVFRTPLINYKTNSGRVPLPDQGPRRQYELILYAIKGKKPVTHIYPDVISSQSDENMSHGAQKPVAVYENLLQRSVHAGDVVLDCFAGTGPIFPAAHTFLCSAIGLELNPEYYAFSLRRLQSLKERDNTPDIFNGL